MGTGEMNGVAVTLLNYFHDLAVALLAANVVCIFIIGRILDGRPVADEVIPRLFRTLSRVTHWALAFVLIGGVVRAINFMEYEWNPAVGKGLIPAIAVKHVLLVGLTVFALVVQRKYRKRYGG
jgi:hypothetical protein